MKLTFAFAAVIAGFAAVGGETVANNVEIWNEGVEYYRKGDVTNALRVLKPLVLSREYGPRAAEVVAKIEYAKDNREEAAKAAQVALRAAPNDARVNRNFTRAIDGLEKLRAEKRIERILKENAQKDPGSIMAMALRDAREIMSAAGHYRTNSAERAIEIADKLSVQTEKLAEAWIPLRQVISQSVTNEEQAATIIRQIESAEAKTKEAAGQLGDLSDGAYDAISSAEHDFNRFFKMTALPPAAIGEDLIAQSNAWMGIEKVNGRDWQNEALDLTRAFRSKFPSWARQYELEAQSDTNRPPFTAEDQAKISSLAVELEKIQIECCEKNLPPEQEEAVAIIEEIRKLMPKDKNGGGAGQGQPPPDKGREKNKQDGGDQNKNQQNENQDQNQGESQQDEQEDQSQDKPKEDEANGEERNENKEDSEVDAILKKAQERNDEHEAEKKARMRKAPLPPNERDW